MGFTNLTVAGFEPTTPRSEDIAATNELNKLFIYSHNSNVSFDMQMKGCVKITINCRMFLQN